MPEETAVNAAPVVAGGGGAPASEPAPAQVSEPQGSTEPAAQSAEPAGSGQTQSTADNNIVASANTGDGKRFVIEKDPVTGKRTVKKIDAEPVAAEQNAEPAAEPEPANSPTAELIDRVAGEVGAVPEPYDLNEFSAALAAGDVDERRVPQEFQKQYTEFRIAQAVEAFKEKQAEETRQKEQLQKQLSPEEQAKAMQEFYKKLNEDAKARALKDFGMTEEQYDGMEFGDEKEEAAINAAIEWHRQQLIGNIQQRANAENVARQQQQARYKDIVDFVADAKAKEPHFNAIDQMMQERFKTLPYAEGRKVEEAITALKNGTITDQQAVTMREYYEATRKEYYAKRNNLSSTPKPAAKPPVVERPGEGKELPKETTFDYAALRNGSNKEKRQWIARFMQANKNR